MNTFQSARAYQRPVLFIQHREIDIRGGMMTVERLLRMIAGGLVAASVLLGIYVNQNFLWLTLFVGVNLFQSSFTQWCPMMTILRKAGVRE